MEIIAECLNEPEQSCAQNSSIEDTPHTSSDFQTVGQNEPEIIFKQKVDKAVQAFVTHSFRNIIHGKLDQECKRVEVDVALGRDARLEDAEAIAAVLADWCGACEAVLASVDKHITRANHHKQRAIRHQQAIEQEIVYIKKTLKSQTESEETASGAGTDTHSVPKKNSGKGKTQRNSAKFWQKST
ncbi:COP9 signalosome complex subunit 7a [Eumeta japonica]|uniref:COP9 signalosome complex subunit 7a n=1 Tax=Eumeta variegata TaxID=151549 RepID=A0A4C1WYZ4_EUMVA|nr:COP9 signalosome complex subunit 7a [Eumeta japonica]